MISDILNDQILFTKRSVTPGNLYLYISIDDINTAQLDRLQLPVKSGMSENVYGGDTIRANSPPKK